MDRVPTDHAARMYGVNRESFRRAMKQEGIIPEVRPRTTYHGGVSYWWDPMEVLKARAVRAERQAKAKAQFVFRMKHDRRGAALKARETRLEQERQKILARLAQRRGITVEELRHGTHP